MPIEELLAIYQGALGSIKPYFGFIEDHLWHIKELLRTCEGSIKAYYQGPIQDTTSIY